MDAFLYDVIVWENVYKMLDKQQKIKIRTMKRKNKL